MPMDGQMKQQQAGQGQGQGEGSDPITATDQMIGAMVQGLAQQMPDLAKRMEAVQAEYRAIMEEASAKMNGGQAPGGRAPSRAMPDQSQGTPMNQAGAY